MKQVEVLVIDFLSTLQILRSVAAAHQIANSTKYGWRQSDLFRLLDLSGQVGTWEAHVPKSEHLKADIQQLTRERAIHLLRVAQEGPLPLVKWLAGQISARDKNLDHYYETVSSYNQINRATLGKLDVCVKLAKTARFTASVGLISGTVAVGLFGLGIPISGSIVAASSYGVAAETVAIPIVGLGKSVAFAVIKEWDKANKAKGISIAFEVGKAGVNEGLEKAGGGVIDYASKSFTGDRAIADELSNTTRQQASRRIAAAEAKLFNLEKRRLANGTARGAQKRAANIATQKAVVQAEKRAMEAAAIAAEQKLSVEVAKAARGQILRRAGLALAGGAVTAFGVWDMYDAIQELGE